MEVICCVVLCCVSAGAECRGRGRGCTRARRPGESVGGEMGPGEQEEVKNAELSRLDQL